MVSALACGPLPPLEIEYQGCLYTVSPTESPTEPPTEHAAGHPTCVLDEGKPQLQLWARSSAGAPIVVQAGSRSWHSADAEPVQGGYLFRLENLDDDTLIIQAGSPGARSQQTLPLSKRPPLPYFSLSREQLEAQLDRGVPARELGFVLFVLASLEGRDGDLTAAAEHFAAAARAHADAGQRSRQILVLSNLHFLLYNNLEKLKEAEDVLSTLPQPPAGEGLSSFSAAYYRGAWANRIGRFRTALRELETASLQAERLGIGMRVFPELERVHLLSRLGRYTEARQLIEWLDQEADRSRDQPCHVAGLLNNIGWSELMMMEAGRADDPIPSLTRALVAAKACGDRQRIRNIETNLTLAYLYQDQFRQAREHFLQVTKLEGAPPWWIRVWSLDIEARIALAEGHADVALALYEQLADRPEATFYADAEWRAAIGLGQALEALNRPAEALAAYARAEEEVWEASLAVPLDEGRQSSVNLYRRGTSRHLDLLLRLGRHQDALELARRARARTLRGLVIDTRLEELDEDEKGEWRHLITRYGSLQTQIQAAMKEAEGAPTEQAESLRATRVGLEHEVSQIFDGALSLLDAEASDVRQQLPAPRSGELLLVYHPLDSGWVGFAAHSQNIDIQRLAARDVEPLDDPDALAARFLSPFAAAIRRADQVKILPHGELWGINFHALPFDDGPLLQQAPVVYGLDLPPIRRSPRASRDALLVSDPTRSLPRAHDEIQRVKHQLESAGEPWRVQILAPPEVTMARVREQLDAGSALFHFSGHGDLIGWGSQSGLLFAEGFEGKARLTIRDILTLENTPATVVLSGCETVRPTSLGVPASLGVGHGFLLAGSLRAIGALDKVDDQHAAELIRLFYENWNGLGSEAIALRQTQLELRHRNIPAWASFRVLER